MNEHTTPDPVDVLRRIAPATDQPDDADLDALLRLTWAQAALPVAASARKRRRQLATGAAVVVALTGGGVAVAAATDGHQKVSKSFAGDFTGPGFAQTPDPSTLQMPISLPGPDGTDFQVFTEASTQGGLCVTTLFEPHGVVDPPVNDVDPVEGGGGGGCSLSPLAPGVFVNGTGGLCSPTAIASLYFAWSAPGVTSAELRLSTGAVLPVAVQNGWLGGWYTRQQVPQDAAATIVALDADGQVVGSRVAQGATDCADTAG